MRSEPTRARRWASVIGLSLDQLVAWGVLYYAYSVLSAPIARDLDVSTRFVAGAFSSALLVSALLARPVGRALDREGARPLLLAGAIVAAGTLGSLAAVRNEVTLVTAFAALGVSLSLSLYEPAFRAVVDWFPVERERSRALLVLTSVGGLASAVFLPLTALLVARLGWRATVLILAAAVAAVTLPVRLALPHLTRAAPDRFAGARVAGEAPAAVTHALAAGFALQSFGSTGATLCLVWHLAEKGEPLPTAAFVAGLAGASQVPGRLLLSPLQRALRSELRLPLLFVVQAGALAAIATVSGPALAPAVLFFGAANGMMTLERAAVVAEWFGRERFGAHSGHIASLASFARAAAPFAVELLREATSYSGVLGVLALFVAAGGVAVALANRRRAARWRSSASLHP
jgi:predicted MFS family arabinose efflux permease